MSELKLYEVSEKYISYISAVEKIFSLHYRLENGVLKIRGSIIPIIRITSQSSSGELELKGTLKLSNMIPVPASELTLYDAEDHPECKNSV